MGLGSFLKKAVTSFIPGGSLIEALAPVVASGVGSLIKSKQGKAEQKQLEEQRRLEAQRADQLARQQWEAQVNSPQAQAARFKNTLQYGRLAAGLGGLEKVPKSLASYYQSARATPEYTGTSSYIPTPQKGGTGWDIAGGIADALGYLDTEKLKRGKTPGVSPDLMAAGNAAARPVGMGALQGGGPATSIIGDYLARQKTQAQPQVALSSGRQITPFDPKLGRG